MENAEQTTVDESTKKENPTCRYVYCGQKLVSKKTQAVGYHPQCKEFVDKQLAMFPGLGGLNL